MCIPLLLSVHPCFCHLPSGCGAAQREGRGPGTAGRGKLFRGWDNSPLTGALLVDLGSHPCVYEAPERQGAAKASSDCKCLGSGSWPPCAPRGLGSPECQCWRPGPSLAPGPDLPQALHAPRPFPPGNAKSDCCQILPACDPCWPWAWPPEQGHSSVPPDPKGGGALGFPGTLCCPICCCFAPRLLLPGGA